jgi:large subunit ribosomal protein LP1
MSALIEAAGVEVEPIWPSLFAKALEGKDLGAFLFNVGSSAGSAPAGAPAAAAGGDAPAAEAKEDKKKKEEVKEESDDDMGFGMFMFILVDFHDIKTNFPIHKFRTFRLNVLIRFPYFCFRNNNNNNNGLGSFFFPF